MLPLLFQDDDDIYRVQVMTIASMMVVQTRRITKVQQGSIQRQSLRTAQYRTGHADKQVREDLAQEAILALCGAVVVSVHRDSVHLVRPVAGVPGKREGGTREADDEEDLIWNLKALKVNAFLTGCRRSEWAYGPDEQSRRPASVMKTLARSDAAHLDTFGAPACLSASARAQSIGACVQLCGW